MRKSRFIQEAVSVAVAGFAFVALQPAGAFADEPSAAVISEGFVVDEPNTLQATQSDASALTTPVLFTTPVSAEIAGGYCQGGFTKPTAMYDNYSYTLERIELYYYIQCQGYNYVDVTFYLERSRWYGWQELAKERVNDSGINDKYEGYVDTPCRAGTWSYRSRASGYASSAGRRQDANAISKSFRHTCHDRTDLTYIDAT